VCVTHYGIIRSSVILTANQRSTIHQAIDKERRRIVRPKATTLYRKQGTGNSLADWCLTEAHGDPLLALDLAASARATILRRQALPDEP
jgi:hypothetical protein